MSSSDSEDEMTSSSGASVMSGSDSGSESMDDSRWGSNKKVYYGADDASDDEAAREEEAEAKRLQQKHASTLRTEDFELMAAPVTSTGGSGAAAAKKRTDLADLTALASSGQLERISKDSPELMELLKEFKANVAELRDSIQPVLQRVREQEVPTQQGISYLETKFHLLLSYCMNIAFYMLLKTTGQPVENHPVVAQLVRLRTTMEKLRPLDQKLRYQIDKLLKKGTESVSGTDPLQFKPRPQDLVAKDAEEGEEGETGAGAGVYKAPKLAAMRYDDDDKESKRDRRKEARLRAASKSQLVREMRAEFTDLPEEIADDELILPDVDTADVRKFEEENMTRLAQRKKERKSRRNPFADQFADFDDFGDVVIEEDAGADKKNAVRKYVTKVDQASREKYGMSGDADLPYASMQPEKRKRKQRDEPASDGETELSYGPPPMTDADNDALYKAAKEHSKEKKKRKEEARKPTMPMPFDDTFDGEHRGATKKMLENRGLTPRRPKDQRNPRVKLRHKFEDAKKRRKGAVREMRSEGKVYGGEATGIRANVSRSVRLH